MVRPSQARKAAIEAEATGSCDKPADKETDAETGEKEFGDHSSTYWPPGWNFDRFSKAGSLELLQELPEGEYPKLQAGIREALGEAGRKRLSDYLVQLSIKRSTANAQATTDAPQTDTTSRTQTQAIPPDWLHQWMRRHRDQAWGFVAMQTACYDDVDRWNDFKVQFRKIVEIPFERDIDCTSTIAVDASAAKAKLEIRWIEDPALDGQVDPDVLRQRYKHIRSSLPAGLSQSVFLVASKDAIASVLDIATNKDSKEEVHAPSTTSKRWRLGAPYILAVGAEADSGLEENHEEREWFKPVFKVAAEVLVDELWHILDSDIMPLRKTTRNVKCVGLDGQTLSTGDDSSDLEDIWWTMAPSPQRLKKRRRIE